jgi:hypothetical protein
MDISPETVARGIVLVLFYPAGITPFSGGGRHVDGGLPDVPPVTGEADAPPCIIV